MDVRRSILRINSKPWIWFGKAVPRSEITYIVQSSVLVIVIIVSLINLSLKNGDHDLNVCLLCSSLGAFLPGPAFPVNANKSRQAQDETDNSRKQISS
jgi:Na+/phosphate symporter